ncbi:hypothetical protein MBLNU230_g2851t1 [Neophaeotheca triangularis]
MRSSLISRLLCLSSALALAKPTAQADSSNHASRPNIVMVMTDDQDRRLGSLEYQSVLQDEIIAKGTEFTNHFGTVAQCCPARASVFRGQAAHNTNITHVNAPGGNYDKWVWSGEDQDYLPMWLKKAGYRTEYIGKFLNGYLPRNYHVTPKGWDHVDALVDPYTYTFNTVVMSENGQKPVFYPGYHQTDVIRAKALARLEHSINRPEPFYIQVAPAAPHVSQEDDVDDTIFPPVPLSRHADLFINASAPRPPNYNPAQAYTDQKPSWLHELKLLNDTELDYADFNFRERIRSLQGVDEIMHDMMEMLEARGELENTYFVFTTDNGYHLGQHRMTSGKATPYAEDTNLPFAVRGPGIPKGKVSVDPGTHVDLAPTFLEIAGLDKTQWPAFLDGRSLLNQWHGKTVNNHVEDERVAVEVVNIEFWGGNHFEGPPFQTNTGNSYKTVRIVDQEASWYFAKWCNGTVDTELYNTKDDPYELTNLAINATAATQRTLDRLNALLLVTKSCAEGSCRQPWALFQPNGTCTTIDSLATAMQHQYDSFFASFPDVQFTACLNYQSVENERPFYPPGAELLGEQHRRLLSFEEYNLETSPRPPAQKVPKNEINMGDWSQRHVSLEEMMRTARELTEWELEDMPRKRSIGDYESN